MTIAPDRNASKRERYETLETTSGREYVAPAGKALVITEIVATGPNGTTVSVGYSDRNVEDPLRPPTGAVEIWSATFETDTAPAGFNVNLRIPGGKYVWSCAVQGAWAMPVAGLEEAA